MLTLVFAWAWPNVRHHRCTGSGGSTTPGAALTVTSLDGLAVSRLRVRERITARES